MIANNCPNCGEPLTTVYRVDVARKWTDKQRRVIPLRACLACKFIVRLMKLRADRLFTKRPT